MLGTTFTPDSKKLIPDVLVNLGFDRQRSNFVNVMLRSGGSCSDFVGRSQQLQVDHSLSEVGAMGRPKGRVARVLDAPDGLVTLRVTTI